MNLRTRLGLWLLQPVAEREYAFARRRHREMVRTDRERYWMGRVTGARRFALGELDDGAAEPRTADSTSRATNDTKDPA